MPNTPQDVLPAPTPQSTAVPTATPETSPTPTPEPTVAPAMATATSNATKNAPQIKDPTTWDDNAAKTLAGLKTQFAAYGLTLDAKEGYPYLLAVNNAGGVVTVYAVDSATKKYAVPFMAMVCSGGMDTPTGYFSTPVDYSWRLLMGRATASTRPASMTATCSTACPTTASTRTMWSTTSSTCWAPAPVWAASGWPWWT